jgi:hypothetical protein
LLLLLLLLLLLALPATRRSNTDSHGCHCANRSSYHQGIIV